MDFPADEDGLAFSKRAIARQRYEASIHEAGHAVVAIAGAVAVEFVELVPGGLGGMAWEGRAVYRDELCANRADDQTRIARLRRVLAGKSAERQLLRMWRGEETPYSDEFHIPRDSELVGGGSIHGPTDEEQTHTLLCSFLGPEPIDRPWSTGFMAALNEEWSRTKAIVAGCWPSIQRVAAELDARGRLDGADVTALAGDISEEVRRLVVELPEWATRAGRGPPSAS